VRTEAAQLRVLDKVVRAAGRIEPDERRIYAISPKFEGYVERLHVNVTGQPVGKGQPLFEVYSPELVSAQREYAIAAQGVESLKGGGQAQDGMKQLAESSLLRLKNWDISEEQVKALASRATAAHADFPLAGFRHRDREEGATGHAFHAGRGALPSGRPVGRLGGRRCV
jgi:multidrug efflux pump subunit AcrA (membrane-fusion protein)